MNVYGISLYVQRWWGLSCMFVFSCFCETCLCTNGSKFLFQLVTVCIDAILINTCTSIITTSFNLSHGIIEVPFIFPEGNYWQEYTDVGIDCYHYNDVIMSAMASQITSLTIVYTTVYSNTDQRKHQSSASLVFVRGIHRGPVNSPHKGPVTRKMFPFDDVIMLLLLGLFDG